MYILAVLISLVILSIIYKLHNKNQYFKNKGIKHEKPMLFFGNMYENATMKKHVANVLDELYQKFKNDRYFGFYQLTTPTLMVHDLELIKKIGIKDFDHFSDHQQLFDEELDPLFSNNLFSMKIEKWLKMRPTLSPSFTSSKMRILFELMLKCSKKFVKFYADQEEDIITVEMKDVFTRYANDVIATCAFGIECDSLRDQTNEFYVNGKDITDFSGIRALKLFIYGISPMLMKLLRIKILSSKNEQFFRDIINETIKVRTEKGIVRPDMIHLLLEARKGNQIKETDGIDTGFATVRDTEWDKSNAKEQLQITDEDIIAQALIFFFAGFDTSSTLLSLVAYELAVNKDIQDKLYEEVQKTLEENNGQISYDGIMKMKYLDMVISETLRKWPPAITSDRKCVKDYVIPAERPDEKDVILPAGSLVWMPVFSLQRDPKYFPNPDKFDPERFNDKNKKNINPLAYLPFGIGPRICIGSRFALMEAKIIVFHLLESFEIVPVEKSVIPLVLATDKFNLEGKGGIWLGFKKRK